MNRSGILFGIACLAIGVFIGHVATRQAPISAVTASKSDSLTGISKDYFEMLRTAKRWQSQNNLNNEARALRHILTLPKSDSLFLRLYHEATPAGRLYALCDLYYTDYHGEFQSGIEEQLENTQKITRVDGDVTLEVPVCDIVRNNVYPERTVRLEYPETLTLWHERTKRWNGILDLEGGGFPSLFLTQPYGW